MKAKKELLEIKNKISNMKDNSKCYCLYVNLTNNYISFKIEEGKFLGKVNSKAMAKKYYAVEHNDDEVNYLQMEDIHKTEKDAYKALIEMLKKKNNK